MFVSYKNIRKAFSLTLFILVISHTIEAQREPKWMKEFPKTENDTYSYKLAHGIGGSLDDARENARKDLLKQIASMMGQAFNINDSGITEISSDYKIRRDQKCEYYRQNDNSQVEVFILYQVAKSGNKDVVFTEYRDCEGQLSQPLNMNKTEILTDTRRNGTKQKHRTESFHEGDSLYLFFRSNKDGWLTVWLADDEGTVYRLLPYRGQRYAQQIESNRDYFFFSPNDNKNADVYETIVAENKEKETNIIYIVFSTEDYMPADTKDNNRSLPFFTYKKEFKKWIEELKEKNAVEIKEVNIDIKKY